MVKRMKKTRIQFDLSEPRLKAMQKLMADLDCGTNKEIFENALTLLEWAAEESANGNTVGVTTKSGEFQRLLFPLLKRK